MKPDFFFRKQLRWRLYKAEIEFKSFSHSCKLLLLSILQKCSALWRFHVDCLYCDCVQCLCEKLKFRSFSSFFHTWAFPILTCPFPCFITARRNPFCWLARIFVVFCFVLPKKLLIKVKLWNFCRECAFQCVWLRLLKCKGSQWLKPGKAC